MFITIYAAGIPFNGATIPEGKSLGGSESAAYYLAKELAKIGHTVTVFTSHQQSGSWDGVRYEWHGESRQNAPLGERFAFAMRAPQDVVIIQRHPRAFEVPPNSKLNIWWLHDLALHRNTGAIQHSLVNLDLIFTVSEFHRGQVSKVYSIDKDHIVSIKNGVDYEQINEAVKHAPERRKKHLCFGSRPERGLEELVSKGGIMEKLSDYHLHVCGYDNTTAQMAAFYQHLKNRCEELPNVTHHGALSKDRLYELLASCQAYVYPTMFEDTSNIMALESAACGTPFIGPEIAALPETCSGGYSKLVKPIKNKLPQKAFIKAIKAVCGKQWDRYHKAAKEKFQSWQAIAMHCNDVFIAEMQMKTAPKKALFRHMEQVSDIVPLRQFYTDDEIEKYLPDFKTNYKFLIEDSFPEHYEAYYQYEKDRGVEYGPETMDGNPRYECIKDIVKKTDSARVLDYGCAHGHYTINLAKAMPECEFIGIDLAESNVKTGNAWAEKDGVNNATLVCGTHEDVHSGYDVIIAAEVIEHIAKPKKVIDSLIDNLFTGGTMIISVPYGPWEAAGYEEHKGWRAHIHHLERQDLKEMFGHFDDYKCLALPYRGNLGHYVLTFTKPEDGRKCGEIDYRRKLEQQSPTQTLSVCMIAVNAEDDIGKCLKSISRVADEIICGVDSSTSDDTRLVLEKYGVRHFDIPPVTGENGIGFATARNLTIEKAMCDWILWIDSDETLENVEYLKRYLRPNPYDGYMINQHHYSAEPAAVLQTDIPCRLFRNDPEVKFWGRVHEHPSKKDANAGLGRVYLLPDIHIMHTGYATEAKRRGRFLRNFPLLKQDRVDNPDRVLGKFLYVRDLAHCVRYELEKTGGTVTGTAHKAAIEAIALWKDLLVDGESHSRYVVDSLHYLKECCNVAMNGSGVPFQASINGIKIDSVFPDTESIEKLMGKVTKANTNVYKEKYY